MGEDEVYLVQKAAEFAVEYNSYGDLELFKVNNSYCKSSACGSFIIYLKIAANNCDDKDVVLDFLTAVRINRDYSIKETLELMQFEDANPCPMAQIVPMPQGFLDNNWEVKLVIDFAIQQFNLKSDFDDKLEFHQLFEYHKSPGKDFVNHYLTLLTYNQKFNEYLVFDTMVVKYDADNFMESSGLKFLSLYPIPDWITLELLETVRSMFHTEDFEWSYPLFRDDEFTANRLQAIADGLGVEQTRQFCIRDLTETRYDVNDHVLRRIAEALGEFIPYVGGMEYAHVLLQPLGKFCTIENHYVRDKAVESLCKIGEQMKDTNDFMNMFIPFVMGLATSELFTARASSCGLFHIAYASAPKNLKTKLWLLYEKLREDDNPVVRRSAALNFKMDLHSEVIDHI